MVVRSVGAKVEQHSPSPERDPEPKARVPKVYAASFGFEIAGKYKNPPEDEAVRRALHDISKWEWSEFMKVVERQQQERVSEGISNTPYQTIQRCIE